MENYTPGIGVVAGSLMLKWDLMDAHILKHDIHLQAGDDINVFINFESVIRNLSMQKGINGAITFHKQRFVIELESAILNLMASYRAYFKRLKCNPRMFFYYTSLDSEKQRMKVYNKYYRDYYRNRYMQNPSFNAIGQLLINTIIPEIQLILSYLPGCYFITADTFDGSIIPMVVASMEPRKNIIISGDVFDTLYMLDPNFCDVYIKRRFSIFSVTSDIQSTIPTIIKDESITDLNLFRTELYYRLLLSIKGSKIRNIASAKGFGYGRFLKIIKQGIESGQLLSDFESIDSIIQLFPERYRDDIKLAFQCTSIDTQFEMLPEADITGVQSQIIDRSDMESVYALNNQRFLEFPINLIALTQQ